MVREPALLIHGSARLGRISTRTTLFSVGNTTLDAVDRQIIHILTIEPRASFRTIAAVTGVSDQTAARRYRRLAESAGLRVLGVPNGSRLGWTDWFLRLQTTPGGSGSLAEALARRPDTRWVHLASGGTEIICTLTARTDEQRDDLILHGLPGSRRVVQLSAHNILHDFAPGPWRQEAQALSAAQLAQLPQPPAAGPPGHAVLLGEDEPLLAELARDGRASSAALGAAIHWHESTVRRRIEELRQAGLLIFEVDVDNRVLGLNTHAILWLSIEPARLEEAGRALARHPVIPFAAATTGVTNLVASALFRNTQHLYGYLTGELASLPGMRTVETAPIIRTLKRTGAVR
jgi:DNA-binding Lrp family transcriptional regulator